MPTRKQRRRDAKARRHEYEYVYVDDDGNEVAVDQGELRTEKNGAREAKPRKPQQGKPAARGTARRTVEPPSWRRSIRRAALFGPILILAMILLNRNQPFVQQVFPAVFLIAFFIPFSYFTDSLAYRMYRKRLDRQNTAKSR